MAGDDSHGDEADGAHGAGGDDGHHENHDNYAVLLPWFLQVIGVIVFFIITRKLHGLPYTAVMFMIGVAMGYGSSKTESGDILSSSVRMWLQIDYEVLFTVFLPGLLFWDALNVNFHLFKASIVQLLILAFPLVLLGTVLTALVAYGIFPYNWSFMQCMTFGSILAATDPVAVSSLLNEVGAPPRLKVHVSGESLLNDGSAVVFFNVFGGLFLSEFGIEALGGKSDGLHGLVIFLRMALGGVAVGLGFGFSLVQILYLLDRKMDHEDTVLQVTATVAMAYLTFYTAEVVSGMSGVIAVVVCGLVTKSMGGGLIADWNVMNGFWALLEHLLNTVIFALGGMVFGEIIQRELWEPMDWVYMVILYLFVNAIRFLLLFGVFPLNKRIGLGTNWKECFFSSWGGLRGAVGITLALALDTVVTEDFEDAAEDERVDALKRTTKLFGMVGGISLMTLVINGTSSGPLLKKLGLSDSTESRKRIVNLARDATRRNLLDDFIHLMTDIRFMHVDFALVRDHCPLLRDVTSEQLKQAVEENKESVHPALYKPPHLESVLPYFKETGGCRTSMMKARGDFFFGEASIADLGFSKRAAVVTGDAEAEPEPSADLLMDMRLMFVELLRAGYADQIYRGELDPREYEGLLVRTLTQSPDFSHDRIKKGEPLNDWEDSRVGMSKKSFKAVFVLNAVGGACRSAICSKTREDVGERFRKEEAYRYDMTRFEILRALCFVQAHKFAQNRLDEEFQEGTDEAAAAFRTVMKESNGEIRKAKNLLKSQNKDRLKHVISHYFCAILNHKEARHIKQLIESGILLQKEGRHFLEDIDKRIKKIRRCVKDHEGSLEYLCKDEEAVTEGGESAAGQEQEFTERPKRRKRQKSIL